MAKSKKLPKDPRKQTTAKQQPIRSTKPPASEPPRPAPPVEPVAKVEPVAPVVAPPVASHDDDFEPDTPPPAALPPAPTVPDPPAHHDPHHDDHHLDAVPHSHAGRYILIAFGLIALVGIVALVVMGRPTTPKGDEAKKVAATVDAAAPPKPADAATPAAPSDGGAAPVAVADLAQAPVDLAQAPDLAPVPTAPADGGVTAAIPDRVLTPDEEKAYKFIVRKAQRLLDNDNTEEAIPLFKKALEVKPNGSEALFGLACARLDANETEAARIANQGIKVDDSYAEHYLAKGAIAQRRHRIAQARTAYRRYLLLAPNGKYAGEIRTILQNLK